MATRSARATRKPALDFEYCECGCKHSNLWLGKQAFSSFHHLGGTEKHSLYHGHHGRGTYIGRYASAEERNAKIRELALPGMEDELAAVIDQHKKLVAVAK